MSKNMKKNTLYYLEKANGNYVSGESIAESLGVSRMTVSKEVAALRKEGAEIEASTKLGYKLVRPTKKLHPESIYAHLPDKSGIGLALYNKMIRAAAHTVIKV